MPHQLRVLSIIVSLFLFSLIDVNAQKDVTQPGDPAFASSANSPGSEGVANAIDNGTAKYLNFDQRTPNNPPTGFAVSPAVGVTRVIGLRMQSANDAPERDPKTVLLEGSNDPALTNYSGGTWEPITTIDVPIFASRYATQTFLFDNLKAYRHYRWTALTVQTNNGCCMQVAEVEFLGSVLPGDVTIPGDPAIASSANSPGSEGVANAIDNGTAKYLNFDQRNPNNPPTGFVVSPSVGKTLVTGLKMQAANDAPERDPKTVLLEGSNDAGPLTSFSSGNWTTITTISNIPIFASRYATQTFLFDNFTPFRHYRWTALEVQTNNGCCMQIAEVELLGTSAPRDVTIPGDRAYASSANSPGSEGVANAIDNGTAKYLNFDQRNPNNPPTGFAVTPSVGATTVIGLTIQSANDAPERDPKTVLLEGSNDPTITGFSGGTWSPITTISVPIFAARYATQEFYFTNRTPYLHYRWTVLEVQTNNGCCMQVAEVEFLAVTEQVPCNLADFTQEPTDTPVLAGAAATFYAKVNGPWPLQWMVNGTNIAGATSIAYTTPPITTANESNQYTVTIVGCQTSQVARAVLFTPSTTKSIAVNFRGGGANGAPTILLPTDIAGIQQQAYWNNQTGLLSATIAEPVTDSDNAVSIVTLEFDSTAEWGSGTGTENGDRKMLNGFLDSQSGGASHVIFHNVPAGTHSILAYSVNRPLAFNDGNFTVTTSEGGTSPTIYIRAQNADEYNAAPGYQRGTSTNAANRTVANFVRFDNIVLTASGDITLTAQSISEPGEVPAGTAPVNGVQLLLNPPAAGDPPIISTQPANRNVLVGNSASFSVTASGTAPLAYQWRRNGINLTDGGNISGANTATLNISNVGANETGAYSVRVSNSVGSTTSSSAVLSTYNGSVLDRLAGYWKFNETTGLSASNSAAGGQAGQLIGYAGDDSQWVTGKVGGSIFMDGTDDFVLVPDFTKPTSAVSGSAWVWQDAAATGSSILANPAPVNNAGLPLSPFDMGLTAQGDLRALITSGPNNYIARAGAGSTVPLGSWEHVAFVANGSQVSLYTNGVLAANVEYSGALGTPAAACLGIGGYPDPANCTAHDPNRLPWIGRLDEVALWTRALGADEIMAIYNAGQTNGGLNDIPPAVAAPRLGNPTRAPNGDVTFTWSGTGRLQQSSTLAPNSFSDVTPPPTGNTYTVNPASTSMRFYRLIQ